MTVKYSFYFGTVTLLVITAIDLTLRTNDVTQISTSTLRKDENDENYTTYMEVNLKLYKKLVAEAENVYERNILNVLIPAVVFLGLFIDKYVIEIWRW